MAAQQDTLEVPRIVGGIFHIFQSSGFKKGRQWYVSVLSGGYLEEEDHLLATSEIQRIIDEDIAEGNGDRIDHLVMSPYDAVHLYLQGRLTEKHIRHAASDLLRGTVTFEKVMLPTSLGEREFTVKVVASEVPISTRDREGKLVV